MRILAIAGLRLSGGQLPSGGGDTNPGPLSHTSIAEPLNGNDLIAGIP